MKTPCDTNQHEQIQIMVGVWQGAGKSSSSSPIASAQVVNPLCSRVLLRARGTSCSFFGRITSRTRALLQWRWFPSNMFTVVRAVRRSLCCPTGWWRAAPCTALLSIQLPFLRCSAHARSLWKSNCRRLLRSVRDPSASLKRYLEVEMVYEKLKCIQPRTMQA